MNLSESSVVRIAVSHHLHVDHEIEVKIHRRNRRPVVRGGGGRVFGVSLGGLQQSSVHRDRLVPRFLVDACSHLLEHVDTVGLFRKSGSVVRQRALRARLNRGEACLSTAPPCDVACLLKQFCRELPEPLLASDVSAALLEAQLLPSLEARAAATQLLSCLLPRPNASFLGFLLNFLSQVSYRCSENQMSSANLAVVFAPCLLACPRVSAGGLEACARREAAVVETLIENAHTFGVVPEVVLQSVPVLLESKRRSLARLRLGGTSALYRHRFPVSFRPRLPRRASTSDLGETTPEKRQPLRRSLGLETFPKLLVFRSHSLHSGQTSALLDGPPCHTPVRGGPPCHTPVRGGPPCHTPVRGGPPCHTPVRDGPPCHTPVRNGPPCHTPVRGGPPCHTPVRNGPPCHTPVRGDGNGKRSIALKRTESGNVGCFSKLTSRERDSGWSPVLTGLATLNGTPWRRRSALLVPS